MFPANAYVIRFAGKQDEAALRDLAQLDSNRPITGAALVGEIDGRPAAAISLADGRLIADPFQRTAHLTALLNLRARGYRAFERKPSLRERMLAGVRPAGASAAAT
jgi:hypothetical protein